MRRMLPLLAGLLVLALVLPAGAMAKPPTSAMATVPVTGTLADGTGSVTGTFAITRFVARADEIVALGTFSGTVRDEAGNVLQSGTRMLALPVTVSATCEILHLELGPLDLNLLGLMVHLDRIVLDITAVSGPGNLLGNLLCAIAGLLDPGPGPLTQIVALLNQILAILQGI
jgi:hypothetical protein